jgi:hypothetical protein
MAEFNAEATAFNIIEAEGLERALAVFLHNVRTGGTSLDNLTIEQLALVATWIVGEQ